MASQYPLKVSSEQYIKDQDDLVHLRRALAIATEALKAYPCACGTGVAKLAGSDTCSRCEAIAAIAREVGP